MNKLLSALALTLLAASAASAAAPETPPVFARLKPKVGAWAEYSFETKKGDSVKSKGVYRMSVVGKDGDAVWMEQKVKPEIPKPKRDEAAVMKFLMGKDGIQKAFMKTSHGVMDMSGMMSAAARKKPAAAAGAKLTEAGKETVEVPAGKFKTIHYTLAHEKSTGDSWFKEGVGPYGMIKQVHEDGGRTTTLVLLAYGDDAKSEVDETTAQTFGGMMMGHGAPAGKAGADADDGDKSDAAKPETPSLGGFLKSALKKKALGQ